MLGERIECSLLLTDMRVLHVTVWYSVMHFVSE